MATLCIGSCERCEGTGYDLEVMQSLRGQRTGEHFSQAELEAEAECEDCKGHGVNLCSFCMEEPATEEVENEIACEGCLEEGE